MTRARARGQHGTCRAPRPRRRDGRLQRVSCGARSSPGFATLRATPLGFEDVSTLALASFASKRPEINAAANESFFEKAPLVFGSELGLALLVYVALKIAGKGDALEGYDLLGRKKEPKE